jgi:sporulation protein YlmC with PRC-barrel domain
VNITLRTILAATVAVSGLSTAAAAQQQGQYWPQQGQMQYQGQAGQNYQQGYSERLRAQPHMQDGQSLRTAPFFGPESTRTVNGQTGVAQAREQWNVQNQQNFQSQQGFQGQQRAQVPQRPQWSQAQQWGQIPQGAQGQQWQGQQRGQGQMAMQGQPLEQVDQRVLRTGFRGESLLDADVIGTTGDDIGDVENVLIGPDDRIVAIIAEVGGFWDIGDTHVAVPWSEVQLTGEGVRVPVTEENIENYSVFRNEEYFTLRKAGAIGVVDDDLDTGSRVWKLSELVDDYAVLRTGASYGYVDDVVFSQDGRLEAVVVTPDARYGYAGRYAHPFYGFGVGWAPRYQYYQLPYDRADVAEVAEFDGDRMEGPLAD